MPRTSRCQVGTRSALEPQPQMAIAQMTAGARMPRSILRRCDRRKGLRAVRSPAAFDPRGEVALLQRAGTRRPAQVAEDCHDAGSQAIPEVIAVGCRGLRLLG